MSPSGFLKFLVQSFTLFAKHWKSNKKIKGLDIFVLKIEYVLAKLKCLKPLDSEKLFSSLLYIVRSFLNIKHNFLELFSKMSMSFNVDSSFHLKNKLDGIFKVFQVWKM